MRAGTEYHSRLKGLKFYCAGDNLRAFLGSTVITLTDAQQDAILNLARPLQPSERVAFMAAIAEQLTGRRVSLGDGELGRTLRDLQRAHFHPPTDDEVGMRDTWHELTARADQARPPRGARS